MVDEASFDDRVFVLQAQPDFELDEERVGVDILGGILEEESSAAQSLSSNDNSLGGKRPIRQQKKINNATTFQQLDTIYVKKFGFPFVFDKDIYGRDASDKIVANLCTEIRQRTQHTVETEILEAMKHLHSIAAARIKAVQTRIYLEQEYLSQCCNASSENGSPKSTIIVNDRSEENHSAEEEDPNLSAINNTTSPKNFNIEKCTNYSSFPSNTQIRVAALVVVGICMGVVFRKRIFPSS